MDVGPDPNLLAPPIQLNDIHKKWDVAIFIIVFLIVASLTAVLRLVFRWKSKTFGLDDWAMVPALVCYIAHSIMACYVNAKAGIGKPLWEVTMPEFELWGKGLVMTSFLYPLASGFVRISILLFYDRVFSKASKPMRIVIRASLVFVGCYIAGFVTYAGFLCKPLHKFWKPFERREYCGDNVNYWIYTALLYSVSLLQDLELLFLPIGSVIGLQMPLKRRIGVIIIFALGTSACVAAAYKLAIFGLQWGRTGTIDPRWYMSQASRVIPPQFDKYGYTMWIPTQSELSAAIIGPSLIALKPYLRTTAEKLSTRINDTFGSAVGTIAGRGNKPRSADMTHHTSNKEYVKMDDGSKAAVTDFELHHVRSGK
ncbi:uncharacterized protein BDR25DRAFT_297833 [Lindgomyces ingoldianus]|uniref:Uncharacterized protein n=1 Tax=Lindgomyces ingoldianus TaxID=673940 RepID=A0ACB6QBC0_9PLEO|nr:uncharacterized protein BDR25DRAFT_297833 [Lindgomyces ingoldianus]KAF2463677.1 hypothetical protein BDR25DRAFT_297833 [Lindgomyces ingoldianus]